MKRPRMRANFSVGGKKKCLKTGSHGKCYGWKEARFVVCIRGGKKRGLWDALGVERS